MHRIDGAGATADNKFTEGDAATGVAATVVTDDWLNSVQEEIVTVIEQTGGTLDKAQTNQLWTRLSAWFAKAQTATEALVGQVRIGTQAEVDAGSLDDVAVTPKKLRFGFQAVLATNGYVIFPSWLAGVILQWGAASISGSSTAVSYNVAYPQRCAGAAIMRTSSPSSSVEYAQVTAFTLNSFTAVGYVSVDANTTTGSMDISWFSIGW